MNDRQKMVQELMKKPLRADDEFSFHCDQCGECCRDRIDILLSPFDLCRMAKAIDEPLPEVLANYCNFYVGDTSKMPLVSLKMREDNGKCPFLQDDNRCRIHLSKPSVCALFPLGRCASREEDKTDIFYILQPTDCGDKSETHTPREWMGGFNLEESEQWFSEWQDVVMELSERIKAILPKMPHGAGNEMLTGTGQIIYLNYDLEKPLVPHLKDNCNLACGMISMLENVVATYGKCS